MKDPGLKNLELSEYLNFFFFPMGKELEEQNTNLGSGLCLTSDKSGNFPMKEFLQL